MNKKKYICIVLLVQFHDLPQTSQEMYQADQTTD